MAFVVRGREFVRGEKWKLKYRTLHEAWDHVRSSIRDDLKHEIADWADSDRDGSEFDELQDWMEFVVERDHTLEQIEEFLDEWNPYAEEHYLTWWEIL